MASMRCQSLIEGYSLYEIQHQYYRAAPLSRVLKGEGRGKGLWPFSPRVLTPCPFSSGVPTRRSECRDYLHSRHVQVGTASAFSRSLTCPSMASIMRGGVRGRTDLARLNI